MQHHMFDQLCKKETCIAKNGQICNYYPACKMPHFHLSLKCSLKPEFGIFRPHLKIALKIVGLDFYTCICITCAQTKYDHIKGKNICGFVSYGTLYTFEKKMGFENRYSTYLVLWLQGKSSRLLHLCSKWFWKH